ncbi:MAG: OmpA family protein [Flavobacteriales bacterium]
MRRLVILFAALAYTLSFAQSKKELVELGDAAFKKENYGSAIFFYKKVLNPKATKDDLVNPYQFKASSRKKKASNDSLKVELKDEREVYVLHRIAESFRLLKDYDHAEAYYKLAIPHTHPGFKNAKYWYAEVLLNNQKAEDACRTFDEFANESENSEDAFAILARKKALACSLIRDPLSQKNDVNVQEMDSVFNSGISNFALSYFGREDLMITAARADNKVNDPKKEDGTYTTDLYIAKKIDSTQYELNNFGIPINSSFNEGSSWLTFDRKTIYFTRWNPYDRSECNIYVSRNFNGMWLEPMKLNINREGFKTMNPMVTQDDKRLYFSSNRPGGMGGMDIWYCEIDEDGFLSDPYNAGEIINTPGDEVTPFYHQKSNVLFFSSNGHIGFGGLDIFTSRFDTYDNAFESPMNMGSPYNSSKDDQHFIIDDALDKGYFTSDRKDCGGCDTLEIAGRCNTLYELVKGEIFFRLSGYVYHAETDDAIPNALISFKDVKGVVETFFITTDDQGYYEIGLGINQMLFLKAQKTKFFGDAASVTTVGLTESTELTQDFYLRPIPQGEIEIEGIEYDFDKATLRPKSKEILDKLYDFLVLNNNITIQINSHTDERGNDRYNQRLSEARAKSCVDYLISKGIPKDRMIAVGYGESQPLYKDAQTEEEHQRNRRTSFTVVTENFQK